MDDGHAFDAVGLSQAQRFALAASPAPAAPPPLTTRPASLQDAAAITAIYNQGIADRLAGFETEPRSPGQVVSWVDGGLPVVVVCRPSGEVVAFAAAFAHADRGAQAGVADFQVHVRRDWRGQGAGRAALDALVDAARDAGLWKLLARVFPENAASRALARRLGFKEIGVHEKHGRLDGAWKDCVIVERLLPENLA